MKVTVYGGTNNKKYTPKEIEMCEKFGVFLAGIGAEVLTGACGGYPYYVGKAVVQNGGRVIGYSPARNHREHVDAYKYPLDGVSELVFREEKKGSEKIAKAQTFMNRSIDMTPFSDVVVALGGSWGTFFELLLSFWHKKTMILVQSFEGAVKAFDNTYKFFGSRDVNPEVHNGPKIIRVKDIKAAAKEISKINSKNLPLIRSAAQKKFDRIK